MRVEGQHNKSDNAITSEVQIPAVDDDVKRLKKDQKKGDKNTDADNDWKTY